MGLIVAIASALCLPIDEVIVLRASAESIWIDTTQSEFSLGTGKDVVISGGNLTLELKMMHIEDDFKDETKIADKNNVVVDTMMGEVRLLAVNPINKTYGGPGTDFGWDVRQTPDNGYILAGEEVSFGPGGYDAWIIKTDASGNQQWSKIYGGFAKDGARSIDLTSDGGYILGGYTDSFGDVGHDFWLLKMDADGNEEWNETYGGSSSEACWKSFSVHQTADGGYIITGYTLTYGQGSYDVWLIKTNALGAVQWDETYGGTGEEFGNAVQQTIDGGYIIAGYTTSFGAGGRDVWLIKADSSGGIVWNKTWGGKNDDWGGSVYQTADGGYIITGETETYSTGGYDIWLIKTDEYGNEKWNVTFGEPTSNDRGYAARPTFDGGYILQGVSIPPGGATNTWLIKTNDTGIQQWRQVFGGPGSDWALSAIPSRDGGYAFIGDSDSWGAGQTDIWLVKAYDPGSGGTVGTVTSNNLIMGRGTRGIEMINFSASIPSGSSIEAQFSSDGFFWSDAHSIFGQWEALSNGFSSIDLSALVWGGTSFYYRARLATISGNIPALQNVNLSFSGYPPLGTFVSREFDGGSSRIRWIALASTQDLQVNTAITFQFRTSDTFGALAGEDFVGPDGSNATYYDSTPIPLWPGHDGERWAQYKAYLTSYGRDTPVLQDVTVRYNIFPDAPILTSPPNDSWNGDGAPLFSWVASDPDGMQAGFRVLIDDDPGFNSVNYDSGMCAAIDQFWQFPNGTAYVRIADGMWYWKVSTMDNDGDWGQDSLPWILRVDSAPPTSTIISPTDGALLNILPAISGTSSDGSGSGVALVEVSIRDNSNGLYWDGASWGGTENWLPASGNSSWSIVSGLPMWVSNVSYLIRSRAIDMLANVESPGGGTNFTFDAFAPPPPINPIVSPSDWTSLNSFDIDWTSPFDVSGVVAGACYKIDAAPTSNADGTWIAAKPITGIAVPGEGMHTVYIWLKDTIGNVNYLNYSAAVLKYDVLPNPPQGLSATAGSGEVALSWSPPIDFGGSPITNYLIHRATISGGETFLVEISNLTSYLDMGLSNGQAYFYKVSARNAIGEGMMSNEASAIPTSPPTAPSAPQSLLAMAGDGQVTLSWLPPLSDGGSPVVSYRIYRGVVPDGESFLVEIGTALSHVDIGVTNDITYYYIVTAKNSVGEGADSNEVTATPISTIIAPSEPKNLQAVAGDGQIILTWMAPSTDGGSPVTNYRVYRGTSSGNETFLEEIADVLFYVDAAVTNGVVYYYEITAKNAAGEGAQSNEVSAAPYSPPPPNQAPNCLIAAPSPDEIVKDVYQVAGTASDPDGIVEYVEIRVDNGAWLRATGDQTWNYNLDTKTLADGDHVLQARSFDGENFSSIESVNFTIQNHGTQTQGDSTATWIVWILIASLVVTISLLVIIFLIRRRRRRIAFQDEKRKFPDRGEERHSR